MRPLSLTILLGLCLIATPARADDPHLLVATWASPADDTPIQRELTIEHVHEGGTVVGQYCVRTPDAYRVTYLGPDGSAPGTVRAKGTVRALRIAAIQFVGQIIRDRDALQASAAGPSGRVAFELHPATPAEAPCSPRLVPLTNS